MHGETAIDDTSLVSFSSSLACPRGNRISGVNSSVDYPDEVRPLNLLAPRKERKKQMFKQLGHRRPRELITHMSHQSYMFELVSNLTTDYQTHMFGLVSHLGCRTLQHHLDNLGLLGLRRLRDALGQLALKLRRGLGLPGPPPLLAITAASLCIHRAGDLANSCFVHLILENWRDRWMDCPWASIPILIRSFTAL